MLDRFNDRTLEIATVVIVVLTALVLLYYATIFVNPWLGINPFPPPTHTPEATPVASLATQIPTWTATATEEPSSTPTTTPTWTPTASPTASNTPTATSTPTETPIPTETPTSPPAPTNTRRPPPPPQPTATPTPWPYDYSLAEGGPDCASTWVWGYVLGPEGFGEQGVQMRVGNDQGWRENTWTDVNGYYSFQFASGPKAGKWFVRVFKGDQARSMQFWFQTSAGCSGPYALQQVHIDWRRR